MSPKKPKRKASTKITNSSNSLEREKRVLNFIAAQYEAGPGAQSLMKAKTKDGYEVKIKKIFLGLTYSYSGIIYGVPNEAINDKTVFTLASYINDYYKDRYPVFFRKPETTTFQVSPEKSAPVLPRQYYAVELESKATDNKNMGSTLVAIFFHLNIEFENLAKTITADVATLEYKKHAVNWTD